MTYFSAPGIKCVPTFENIISNVAAFYKIDAVEMLGRSRKKEVVIPRQICHSIARYFSLGSLDYIGRNIGGLDHATVRNSCSKIQNYCEFDKKFNEQYTKLLNLFLY
jgi:chromosomal replication initiator protein